MAAACCPPIGIDLGTTNSCVGIYKDGYVHMITNEHKQTITPSIVAFNGSDLAVGEEARTYLNKNPGNTIYESKRFIGRRYNDESVQRDKTSVNYEVIEKNGMPWFRVRYRGENKDMSPEQIGGMILKRLSEVANRYVSPDTVKQVVVTVPAYFTDNQRNATKAACKIAGLELIRIVNEPTAAAIAFDREERKKLGPKNLLVYDLGGGTFDVSVIDLDASVHEVKATNGDTTLGGKDFDERLVSFCINEIKRLHKINISKEKEAMARIRYTCWIAKHNLSVVKEAHIRADCLQIAGKEIDVNIPISREKFESINNDLFARTIDCVKNVLLDAKLKREEIDEVLLVGGSTRIPKIRSLLKDFFHGKKLNSSLHPDEAVAKGAAILAASLTGHRDKELDDLLLLDVIPLSLGIEVKGEVTEVLLKRNRTIPTKEKKSFTTVFDNQTTILFKVLEGERAESCRNNLLDKFELKGIPPAPRGKPNIDVTFDINHEGVLRVYVHDKDGGKKRSVTIKQKSEDRLSDDEIKRMAEEGEKFKEADAKHRERVTAKNRLDHAVYRMKKAAVRLSETDRIKVTEKCEYVESWLQDEMLRKKKKVPTATLR